MKHNKLKNTLTMSKRTARGKSKSRDFMVLSPSQPSLTQMNFVRYSQRQEEKENEEDEGKDICKHAPKLSNKSKVVSPYDKKSDRVTVVPMNDERRPKESYQIEPPNRPPTPHGGEDLSLDLEEHIPKEVQEEEDRMKADVDRYEQDERLFTQSEEEDEKEDCDEEIGDYVSSVIEPAGTIGTYKSPLGELEYAMPHLTHTYEGTSPTLIKVRRPKLDKVFNTFFHFKDRKYNSCLHKIVNGLIREWRRGIHNMCDELDKTESLTNRQGYRNQRNYADATALMIQHCIANYDEFPVKILNMEWMTKMVPAVKSLQDARFLYHMANCKYFQLSSNKVRATNEAHVMTTFNGKVDVLIGYKA